MIVLLAIITIDVLLCCLKFFFDFLQFSINIVADIDDVNRNVQMKILTIVEMKNDDFENNNANVSNFRLDFNFDDFINENLSIHFVVDFDEIVVDDKKINDEEIVNIDEIVDKMKIHFSKTKNVIVVNCDQLVIVNAKFDDKIMNIDENFQNDRSKNDMNFDYAKIIFLDVSVFQFSDHLKINFSILNEFSNFSIKNIENHVFDDDLICCSNSIEIFIDDDEASDMFKKCIDIQNDKTIANVNDN